MPDAAQPEDIMADLAKMIGEPSAQNGGVTPDSGMDAASGASEDEMPEFETRPTDPPDFVERMKKARQTVTNKTTAIRREREQLKQQQEEYKAAMRDAELFRALKQSADPQAAIKAVVGDRANSAGSFDPNAVLAKAKERFDEPTYEGIRQIAEAIWLQQAQQHLTPYQQMIHTLAGDRGQNEWRQVVSEYGDDAEKWRESAQKLQQQNPGLSISDALLVASKGDIALSKIRAKVADARKRQTAPASIPPGTTEPLKIGLTRTERKAALSEEIRKRAQALGIEQFSR